MILSAAVVSWAVLLMQPTEPCNLLIEARDWL